MRLRYKSKANRLGVWVPRVDPSMAHSERSPVTDLRSDPGYYPGGHWGLSGQVIWHGSYHEI
jgi:hypothetical protein